MPMKCSRRPLQSLIARHRQDLVGDPRAASGIASERRGRRHLREPLLVAEQRRRPRRRAARRSAPRRRSPSPRPASAIQAALALWWSAVGVRVGNEDRRAARRRSPRRSSRPSGPAPGRRRRGSRRGRARRRAGCSARGAAPRLEPRSQLARSRAGPARWTTWKSRPVALGEGLDRAHVDRAGALAAAHHQQADGRRRRCRSAPRGLRAVGLQHGRRHRPPGHQVAVALPPRDREGEADPPGPPGEQAVGEPEVAVGLGQDQRRPRQHARPARPDRRRSRRRPSPRRRRGRGAPAAQRRPRRSPRPRRAAARNGLRRSIPRTLRKSIS